MCDGLRLGDISYGENNKHDHSRVLTGGGGRGISNGLIQKLRI